MRPLVSRGLLLPTLVCTALILGPVGTAAAVVDAGRGASDHGVAHTAAWYGTDDTDTLTDRLDALDRSAHGSVIQPLLDAVTDLTALDGTHLDASEAAAHAKAVEAAGTAGGAGTACGVAGPASGARPMPGMRGPRSR